MSNTVELNAEGYLEPSSNEPVEKFNFKGIKDIFGGITINTDKEKCKNEEEFEGKLVSSLATFKKCAVRGVWLRISINDSSFIPIAIKHGFLFHHTYPTYIVLTRWLPEDEPNTLPSFATSYLGAGGLVVNEKNQVLAVCERFSKKKHWKLPGGMVDRDEDIVEAVKREVLEETGIQTKFVSLICFRQIINFRFGCSDIYFICHLKPLTQDINIDTREIADAQWMDLDEYIASPLVNDSNRFIAVAYKNNFHNNDNLKVETKKVQVGRTFGTFFSLNQYKDQNRDDDNIHIPLTEH
ncbi:uncharacterized protein LOC144647392 [Oculina patagonica]